VLAWLRSPAAERLRAAERRAALAGREAVADYMARMQEGGIDAGRRAAVARLAAVLPQREARLDLADVVLRELAARRASADRSLEARALARALERRPDLRRRAARLAGLWALHFSYREVPVRDVAALADFLDSDAGRWYAAAQERSSPSPGLPLAFGVE
jgi:hypothetical protein